MIEYADLHTHSTRSDGFDTVRELIDNAAATEGLRVLALCDHDVLPPETIDVDGFTVDPVLYAASKGVILLPAIEISCDTYVDDVHIVGLFCNMKHPGMIELENRMLASKTNGYKKLCELLVANNIDVSWQFVLDQTGRKPQDIQRKHIFEAIASRGYAPDWRTAKLLVRDNPALNFRREKPEPKDAIDLIHSAGGQAILAHPYLIDSDIPRAGGHIMTRCDYIDMLIDDCGIDAMEADYPYSKTSYKGEYSLHEIVGRVYEKYGDRLHFLSGGSDYHAEYKKRAPNARELGEGHVSYGYFQRMILPYRGKNA